MATIRVKLVNPAYVKLLEIEKKLNRAYSVLKRNPTSPKALVNVNALHESWCEEHVSIVRDYYKDDATVVTKNMVSARETHKKYVAFYTTGVWPDAAEGWKR